MPAVCVTVRVVAGAVLSMVQVSGAVSAGGALSRLTLAEALSAVPVAAFASASMV